MKLYFLNIGLRDADLLEAITKFLAFDKPYHLWTVVFTLRDCKIRKAWEITVETKSRFASLDLSAEFMDDLGMFLSEELESRRIVLKLVA